jgi:hypothetical protein
VRNAKALLALLAALLALGVLGAAAYVAQTQRFLEVSWIEAAAVVPAAALLALLSLSLAGRARDLYGRTLGRVGGRRLAGLARLLASLALLVSLTAGLAVGVFGVLVWTDGLTRAPW